MNTPKNAANSDAPRLSLIWSSAQSAKARVPPESVNTAVIMPSNNRKATILIFQVFNPPSSTTTPLTVLKM